MLALECGCNVTQVALESRALSVSGQSRANTSREPALQFACLIFSVLPRVVLTLKVSSVLTYRLYRVAISNKLKKFVDHKVCIIYFKRRIDLPRLPHTTSFVNQFLLTWVPLIQVTKTKTRRARTTSTARTWTRRTATRRRFAASSSTTWDLSARGRTTTATTTACPASCSKPTKYVLFRRFVLPDDDPRYMVILL